MARDTFQLVGVALDAKYRVDEVVGEGGFGVVYKGFHLNFERPIAIKCLKVPGHFTDGARDLFLTKFKEEGKHLAALSDHASVTQVYDFGIEERPGGVSVPYLVLEWLEGRDLEELLQERQGRGKPYGEQEALELLRPAIDALAFAHADDIAHRDIKPANLFLAETKRGAVLKVLDFGIAKAMQEGETATQVATKTSSGFSAFSPSYGAPEQFRSKKYGATGPWTDVHALGLILVEMVTGKPALDGEEMVDFYEAATDEQRPTPIARGAKVSAGFDALCRRAVALSAKERYADAKELLAAVDALIIPAEPLPLHPVVVNKTVLEQPVDVTVFQGPVDEDLPEGGRERGGKKKKKAKTKMRRVARTEAGETEIWDGPPGKPPAVGDRAIAAKPNVGLWAGALAIAAVGVWLVARDTPAEVATDALLPGPSHLAPSATDPSGVSPSPVDVPVARPDPAATGNPFPDGSALAKRFMEATKTPDDVAAPPADAQRSPSGLAYVVKRKGFGQTPGPHDRVQVAYTGWTTGGRMFDTSYAREDHEVWFPVGGVIPGWTEGLQLMKAGSIYRLWVPANLAYGEHPPAPQPGGMLVFDVELVAVEAGAASQPPSQRTLPPAPTPRPTPDTSPPDKSIYDGLTFRKRGDPPRPPPPPPPAPPSDDY